MAPVRTLWRIVGLIAFAGQVASCLPIPNAGVETPATPSPVRPSAQATAAPTAGLSPIGPVASQTSVAQPAQPSADVVLLEYRRSGGFAGYNDVLTFPASGRCELTRKGRPVPCKAQPAAVEQAMRQFEVLDFDHIKAVPSSTESCCDRMAHVFRYRVAGREQTFTVVDGAIPGELRGVLAALQDLIDA